MAKPKKSRKYTIDGEKYVFNFNASGNLEGITSPKGRNGQLRQNPIDPNSSLYETLSTSDEAISAYNVANYGGNKDAYQDSVTKSQGLPEQQFFDKNKSKFTNEQFVEEENIDTVVENATPKESTSNASEIMSYPLDLNPSQDHFKITKYNYQRRDVNASKPGMTEIKTEKYKKESKSVRSKGYGTTEKKSKCSW